MRAIWTGSVTFGLITIPVKLYPASLETAIDLDLLHKEDLQPIRYARICRKDGKEIPFEDVVKGYEYRKGDYVALEPGDFKKANVHKSETIDIRSFCNEDEIDPLYYERPYYLEPAKGGEKSYALLRDALAKTKKAGIGTFVLRNREHVVSLSPHDHAILLHQLRFRDEIRKPEDLKFPASKASSKELEMAVSLIRQLSAPFRPQEFHDTYIEDLKDIIRQKAKGKTPKPKHEEKPLEPTEVRDLMRLLRESLHQERGRPKTLAGSRH